MRHDARVGHHAGTPAEHEQESLRRGFGARLRELRQAAGLTQAVLAERAGLDRLHVSRLELGRRRPEGRTVRRLVAQLVPPAQHAVERANLNMLAGESLRTWNRRGRPPLVTREDFEAKADRMIARVQRGTPRS